MTKKTTIKMTKKIAMYMTVSEAAIYLNISENAVRSRMKRGSLTAKKAVELGHIKKGQLLVSIPISMKEKTTDKVTIQTTNIENNEWEVIVAYQKRRIEDLQAERKRLSGLLTQHVALLERETAWREGLQGQFDQLAARLESAAAAGENLSAPVIPSTVSVDAVAQARTELENQLKPALSRILESLAKTPAGNL